MADASRPPLIRVVLLLGLLLWAQPVLPQSGEVRYVYDVSGRLVGVVDQNGNGAVYTYDAVGNLVSITRTTVGDVAVIALSPGSGGAGSTVTISGLGFGATNGSNTVSFNGTAATVTAQSSTSIVAVVPAGATTGPVTVIAPTGTAVSATPFVVTATVPPPAITGFTPAVALPLTSVTVTGTGFDPVPAQNRLAFNQRLAPIATASATQLDVTLPPSTTSGRLTLSTLGGSTTSTADLFVPPAPFQPSDVDTAVRAEIGQPQAVSITTANHVALVVFDGAPGRRVVISTVGSPSPNAKLYQPNGLLALSGSSFVDTTPVPVGATYTLLLDPSGTATPNYTVTVSEVPPDVTATAVIGGPAVPINVVAAGQNARVTFTGTAGQRIGARIADLTIPWTEWSIRPADGPPLGTQWSSVGSPQYDFLEAVLPSTGTYWIDFNPELDDTGSFNLTLAEVAADVTGTITPGGPPVTIATTEPGQNGSLTFTGTAGQRVSLLMTDFASGVSIFTDVSMIAPDGSTVMAPAQLYSGNDYRDTVTLPLSGTYTIRFDPEDGRFGAITFTLFDVPPDLTDVMVVGTPKTVALSISQNGTLTFAGTAGQQVTLQMSSVTITQTDVRVFNPDGTPLSNQILVTTSGATIADMTLGVTGTYSITVNPRRVYSGSMTLTLFGGNDIIGTITPGGPPVSVTTTQPGQNVRLTFAGTAGQRVSLRTTNVTITSSLVSILNPDGSTLGSVSSGTSGAFLDTKTLATTGTHTVFIDPSGGNMGNMTVTLYDVPSDDLGPISFGVAVPVTIGTPGQNARLTFTGAAGQYVGLQASAVSGATGSMAILRPDGTSLVSATVSSSGALIDSTALPSAGTYTVLHDPSSANTGSLTLKLATDVVGTIVADGAAVPVTIAHAGQAARLTFDGAVDQRVSVNVTALSISGSTTVALLRPDGTTHASTTVSGSGGLLDATVLTVAGTYTVVFNPSSTNTGNGTLRLHNVADVTGPIVPGGAAVPVTIATPGQNARLTFDGTAGQRVSLHATSVTIASSSLQLLRPDGTTLVSATISTSGGLVEATLPSAGSYTAFLNPSGANAGNATLRLYDLADVTGPIVPDGAAVPVTIASPGQNARLTFDGAAGQRMSVNATSVTIGGSTTVAILKPDGTTLASRTVTTSGGLLEPATLPTAGSYTVLLDPAAANTGNATLRLHAVVDLTGPITPGGAAVPLTVATPGQNALLTFTGTAGQKMSVDATSVTIAGSTTVAILRPDGTTLASRTVTTSGGLLEPATLATTGTYTVLLDPPGPNTGNATLRLYDVTDVIGTITPGVAAPVTIATPGQNARLTFEGTVGQRVSLRTTAVTIPSSTVSILRPDGTSLGSVTSTTSGAFLDTKTLNVSGTHTVLLDPAGANTGNTTLTLYDVPADVAGSLTINGGGVPITIATPGQNGALTFSGTAGQQVTVRITGNTAGSITVRLLRPDGSQQTSSTSSSANFNLSAQTLATTGTYTVTVDPAGANTGALTVAVTNP